MSVGLDDNLIEWPSFFNFIDVEFLESNLLRLIKRLKDNLIDRWIDRQIGKEKREIEKEVERKIKKREWERKGKRYKEYRGIYKLRKKNKQ